MTKHIAGTWILQYKKVPGVRITKRWRDLHGCGLSSKIAVDCVVINLIYNVVMRFPARRCLIRGEIYFTRTRDRTTKRARETNIIRDERRNCSKCVRACTRDSLRLNSRPSPRLHSSSSREPANSITAATR